MSPGARLAARLRAARAEGRLALLPYLVAGFPARAGFGDLLERVAASADVLEIGLPFSDPTADGPVLAEAARSALRDGVELDWVCAQVAAMRARTPAGIVLMSYLNPLLAHGLERSLDALAGAGFEGLIVPDLPLEEGQALRRLAAERGLAWIGLVTPLTPPARAWRIAAASSGFLYAVTRTGTTGARATASGLGTYLERLRALSPIPVCAGFGLRDAEQVRALHGCCDGVIVGSALVERLARGEDPAVLLGTLREAANAAGSCP